MSDNNGSRVPMWVQMSAPSQPGLSDAGPQLLDQFRTELAMDHEWTVQEGRDLFWWGAPLPLAITVDDPRVCEGDPTIKITASVVVVENVSADAETVVAVLADHNQNASVASLTWNPTSHQVFMFLTHYSYGDNARFTEIFSPFAMLAYTEALAIAFDLGQLVDGEIPTYAHPVSGPKRDFDEMLNFTSEVVLPKGQRSGDWPAEESSDFASQFTAMGFDTTTDHVAVTSKVPVAAGVFSKQPATSLFQLLPDVHHFYGHGVTVLLHLPTLFHPARAAQLASELNDAELATSTGTSAFGAWSTGANGCSVVHRTFLPNMFARPGLMTTVAYQALSRNLWASAWFRENQPFVALTDEAVDVNDPLESETSAEWESRMISYLANLRVGGVPSLEVLFIDALATWLFSPDNPGQNYDNEHGGQVITALLESAGRAGSYRPERQPASTPEVEALRARIAIGANDIAAAERGFGTLISRLMPAAVGELKRYAGDPGSQAYWLYAYGMFVLVGGNQGVHDDDAMRTITDTFAGWDALMRNGFKMPSQ